MLHRPRRMLHALLLFAACASACGEDGSRDADLDAHMDARVDARMDAQMDARLDALTDAASSTDGGALALEPVPSMGCAMAGAATYPVGTSTASLNVAGSTRTFRVHVPADHGQASALPVVLMFHGGGGSGRQLQSISAEMDAVADREGFVTVYPDGLGVLGTWNGGGCCGYAVDNAIDDVGFVAALLDHLEAALCLDRRRVFASGMSNGAIMSHRLACELSERIAAIAPVAGTNMLVTCTPSRAAAVLQIHGTADGHVPWDGGHGCGLAAVSFTSVPDTLQAWRTRNGCSETTSFTLAQGDGRCEGHDACDTGADVVLCSIEGGGHSWPGGKPAAGVIDCPGNGPQSTTFPASEVIWDFFEQHPMRTP